MSVDLPTPPFPDAIASTRVPGESEICPVGGVPAAETRHERGFLLRRHDVESEPHARDSRNLAHEARHLLRERVPKRAADDGQRDRDRHGAVVLDEDVAHHVELRHRPAQLRVDDVLERLQDRVAVWPHRGERTSGLPGRDRPGRRLLRARQRSNELADELRRSRRGNARARPEVERRVREGRILEQLDREPALADEQLCRRDVDRASGLQ